MKQSDKIEKPRRRFLQQLMILGGATGATAVALNSAQGEQPQQAKASAAPAAPAKQGYRLTKHIRTYYEKAQI